MESTTITQNVETGRRSSSFILQLQWTYSSRFCTVRWSVLSCILRRVASGVDLRRPDDASQRIDTLNSHHARAAYPVLCRRGSFLGVAEGLLPGVAAGVEEVTAIATMQALLGEEHARAKLLQLPQVAGLQ